MGTTQALTLHDDQQIARSNQITDVQRLGGLLAASGYFSDAREMAQAAVKVMAGQELGIPPVASMMGINIIKGKVALGGNLIASRIRAHGYDYRHKQFDKSGCVLEFLSKPDANGKRTVLGESSFTDEDAKTAQIKSEMYQKFPRNMYFNRAISNGAKWYTPEVFAGAPVYTPEELGANVDEQGDVIHEEPTRGQQTQARKEVLDRKLAEIRERKLTAPEPEPPPAREAEFPPEVANTRRILTGEEFRISGKFERLAAFGLMKEVLGADDYYRILGVSGVEHANQFTKLGEAVKAYAEMLETHQFAVASRPI